MRAIGLLEPFAERWCNRRRRAADTRSVRTLRIQTVGEAVARHLRPVGPGEQRRRGQELPLSRQLVAALFDRQRIRAEAGRDRRHGELVAEHARHLEQALRLRLQARNLLLDQLAKALRDGARNLVEGPLSRQRPSSASRTRSAMSSSTTRTMKSGFPSVRRCTARASSGLKGMPAEALRQIGADMRLAQKGQRDVLALAAHPQLLNERPQRVSRHDDIHRAIASDHEQARRLLPPREHRQQIERRIVAPVEILEHQENGGRRRSAPRALPPSRATSVPW